MTKAQLIERYGLEWYEQYKARQKQHYHNDPEYRESKKFRWKERYYNDQEFRKESKAYNIAYSKSYQENDLNSDGKTKNYIRRQSQYILFKQRHHSRFKGYEIHHAFGYDDSSKFIYIPKSLHGKIHQYLRDHQIDADSCHFNSIKHLINEYTGYTYISI